MWLFSGPAAGDAGDSQKQRLAGCAGRETKSAADHPLAQLLADERDHLAQEKYLSRYRHNFLVSK